VYENKIETIDSFSKQETVYYYNKYLLLYGNNFFSAYNEMNLSGSVSPDIVEFQLANLRQVTLEITDRCNLKCEYCAYGKFYEDYNKRSVGIMKFEKVKTLFDFLIDLWNSGLNKSENKPIYISFYGGEPLLNIQLVENVVSYIKSQTLNNNYIKFSMTTNGMLINRHIDYLIENNFSLLISMDGNEDNNSYRITHQGLNSYETVFSNINYIREKHPKFFDTNVNFNAVLHNRNSVEDIYRFFKDHFSKIPSIGELNNMGIRSSMVDEFNKTYRNTNDSLLQAEHYDELSKNVFINLPHIRSIGIFLNNYTGYFFKNFNNFFVGSRSYKRTPTGTCLPFGKKLFLTVHGNILPCERIGQNFSLGAVNDDKIDLNFEKISKLYNDIFEKIVKKCNSCYMAESCIQCVFNLPTINESNIMCMGYTSKEELETYFSSHVSYIEEFPYTYRKIMTTVTID